MIHLSTKEAKKAYRCIKKVTKDLRGIEKAKAAFDYLKTHPDNTYGNWNYQQAMLNRISDNNFAKTVIESIIMNIEENNLNK